MNTVIEDAVSAIESVFPNMELDRYGKKVRLVEDGNETKAELEGFVKGQDGPAVTITLKYNPTTEILKFKSFVGCFGWNNFCRYTPNPDLVGDDVFHLDSFKRHLPDILGNAAVENLQSYIEKLSGRE